jgi:hypothetical protein
LRRSRPLSRPSQPLADLIPEGFTDWGTIDEVQRLPGILGAALATLVPQHLRAVDV